MRRSLTNLSDGVGVVEGVVGTLDSVLRPLLRVHLDLKWNLEVYLHYQRKPRRRSTTV